MTRRMRRAFGFTDPSCSRRGSRSSYDTVRLLGGRRWGSGREPLLHFAVLFDASDDCPSVSGDRAGFPWSEPTRLVQNPHTSEGSMNKIRAGAILLAVIAIAHVHAASSARAAEP